MSTCEKGTRYTESIYIVEVSDFTVLYKVPLGAATAQLQFLTLILVWKGFNNSSS